MYVVVRYMCRTISEACERRGVSKCLLLGGRHAQQLQRRPCVAPPTHPQDELERLVLNCTRNATHAHIYTRTWPQHSPRHMHAECPTDVCAAEHTQHYQATVTSPWAGCPNPGVTHEAWNKLTSIRTPQTPQTRAFGCYYMNMAFGWKNPAAVVSDPQMPPKSDERHPQDASQQGKGETCAASPMKNDMPRNAGKKAPIPTAAGGGKTAAVSTDRHRLGS